MTDIHRKGMASGQLSKFIRNDRWPPNSPEPWTNMSGLLCLGGCWRSITAPSETQVNHRTQKVLQVNWDSLPQESINKTVKSFALWLKRCTNLMAKIRAHKVTVKQQTS